MAGRESSLALAKGGIPMLVSTKLSGHVAAKKLPSSLR